MGVIIDITPTRGTDLHGGLAEDGQPDLALAGLLCLAQIAPQPASGLGIVMTCSTL